MDKKSVIREESDDLGAVVKQLISFDARQRELVADALEKREADRRKLEAMRDEIKEKHMKQAEERLKRLSENENKKADRVIAQAQSAAKKNIAELQKSASENMDYWAEQIYLRTVNDEQTEE